MDVHSGRRLVRRVVEEFRGRSGNRYQLLTRFFSEDRGQDLVEYAFLAAFIGIAGWAVVMTIPDAIGETYESWVDPTGTTGAPSLWDPPEPAGAGS